MKKFYFLASFVLFTAMLMAQPTLQYPQNTPIIGDVVDFQFVSNTGLNTGASGANVSWDFSGLTSTFGGQINAVDPSQAPAGAQFPTSNVAMSIGDTLFTFALTNADGYHYLGTQSTTGTFPSVLVYSDPRIFIKFPFTYDDTYFDTYKGVATTAVANVHIEALTEIFADAWGTLILPTGTYTNVLRTITVDAEMDSVFVAGNFVKSFDMVRTQYSWFAENSIGPLMSIEIMHNSGGSGSTDTVAYYTTSGTGIDEPMQDPISSLSIFPNPADDHVMIAFETSQDAGVTLSIVNQLGQVVINKTVAENMQGRVSERLDINTLPAGIYFASISCTCGKQLTAKFVIR